MAAVLAASSYNKNMKFQKLIRFVTLVSAVVLAACGDGNPTLGSFPDINKVEGDPPFALTAPTSPSPGEFTYTSSNPAVATISGNTVTITGVGTSTITANQASYKSHGSGSISALLTVAARTCTAPATSQNGVCVAPALTGNYVTRSGRNWMPVSFTGTWATANAYCSTTTINGSTGWSAPTEFDLNELYASGAMTGQGWTLSKTWSSTAGAAASTRKTVRLDNGTAADEAETGSAYIACIR
jgi:hypothetical protein